MAFRRKISPVRCSIRYRLVSSPIGKIMYPVKKYILLAAFSIGAIVTHAQNTTATYNVRDFGAIGNGVNLDSKSINRAIDTIASKGGGTLIFPAGVYLSGSIRLKSNITLYLDQGAVIEASPNVSNYDK